MSSHNITNNALRQENRTLVDPNKLPRELRDYRQFVVWRYGKPTGNSKPEKIPINPNTLGGSSYKWPNTWSSIYAAGTAYRDNLFLSGIGFMLNPNDPYVFIDRDSCVAGDLSVDDDTERLINELDSYTEISPSKTGIRILLRCRHQPRNIQTSEIEIYSHSRFATLTGNVLLNQPIQEFDDLDWLISRFKPAPTERKNRPTSFFGGSNRPAAPAKDADLWKRIFQKNKLAQQIYQGDFTNVKGEDYSRAVILLLNSLALWTGGDATRMDRMIRQAKIDQTEFDQTRGKYTWISNRIDDAIHHARGERAPWKE